MQNCRSEFENDRKWKLTINARHKAGFLRAITFWGGLFIFYALESRESIKQSDISTSSSFWWEAQVCTGQKKHGLDSDDRSSPGSSSPWRRRPQWVACEECKRNIPASFNALLDYNRVLHRRALPSDERWSWIQVSLVRGSERWPAVRSYRTTVHWPLTWLDRLATRERRDFPVDAERAFSKGFHCLRAKLHEETVQVLRTLLLPPLGKLPSVKYGDIAQYLLQTLHLLLQWV